MSNSYTNHAQNKDDSTYVNQHKCKCISSTALPTSLIDFNEESPDFQDTVSDDNNIIILLKDVNTLINIDKVTNKVTSRKLKDFFSEGSLFKIPNSNKFLIYTKNNLVFTFDQDTLKQTSHAQIDTRFRINQILYHEESNSCIAISKNSKLFRISPQENNRTSIQPLGKIETEDASQEVPSFLKAIIKDNKLYLLYNQFSKDNSSILTIKIPQDNAPSQSTKIPFTELHLKEGIDDIAINNSSREFILLTHNNDLLSIDQRTGTIKNSVETPYNIHDYTLSLINEDYMMKAREDVMLQANIEIFKVQDIFQNKPEHTSPIFEHNDLEYYFINENQISFLEPDNNVTHYNLPSQSPNIQKKKPSPSRDLNIGFTI